MAKSSKSSKKQFSIKSGGLDAKVPTSLKDRNLLSTSPLKEQFEPTEASPIPARIKMAGGG